MEKIGSEIDCDESLDFFSQRSALCNKPWGNTNENDDDNDNEEDEEEEENENDDEGDGE